MATFILCQETWLTKMSRWCILFSVLYLINCRRYWWKEQTVRKGLVNVNCWKEFRVLSNLFQLTMHISHNLMSPYWFSPASLTFFSCLFPTVFVFILTLIFLLFTCVSLLPLQNESSWNNTQGIQVPCQKFL